MSATTSPNDKFAFLFNTGAYSLAAVKNTLKTYYGFPDLNIKDSAGCGNLATDFQTFAEQVLAHIPEGETVSGGTKKNTVIIFIVGDANTTGTELHDGTTGIDWSTLGYALDPVPATGTTYYYTNSEVHFYLIFPYCDGFYSNISSLIPDGSISFPVTDNFNSFAGQSTFLTNWKATFEDNIELSFNAEKLIAFDKAAERIKSLYPLVTSPLETFFKQRKAGVDENYPVNPFTSYFPGLPCVEIDDGSPNIYKTTDVWLNDLDPEDATIPDTTLYDNYEYNVDNKISVRIHFRGTHPVKTYYVGVGVFRSGGGGECDVNPLAERTVTPAVLSLPGTTEEYFYTEFFEPVYSHRCIKARVSLTEITDASIDNDIDWQFDVRKNEVQLNIDPGGVAKKLKSEDTGTGTEPVDNTVDEADPEEDAEADNTGTGSKSTDNIRGSLERVYLIKNRFKTKLEFRYKIPESVLKNKKLFGCRWFIFDSKYPAKSKELLLRDSKTPWFPFVLRPGEQVEILTQLQLEPKAELREKIDLPFDIIVEVPSRRKILSKLPVRKKFRLHSGVCLVLNQASANLNVKVFDDSKKPVPEAYVYVKTFNGRQSAVCKTNKDGICSFNGINTGPYKVWATRKDFKTGIKVVNLRNKDSEKIELIPDKKTK